MGNTLKIKVFRKAQIFMKFYVVVNYYLVSLSFKFHEDMSTTACTRVVNAQTRVFTTRARAFMHGSPGKLQHTR